MVKMAICYYLKEDLHIHILYNVIYIYAIYILYIYFLHHRFVLVNGEPTHGEPNLKKADSHTGCPFWGGFPYPFVVGFLMNM